MKLFALLALFSVVSCDTVAEPGGDDPVGAVAARGGSCGDGVCDQKEQSKGVCPEDCSSHGSPALAPAPVGASAGEIPTAPVARREPASGTGDVAPLFLSVIIHAEEDIGGNNKIKNQIPDYDGDKELMLHFTKVMREFAEFCEQHGAHVNFGSDWTFADGVRLYDPGFFTDLEAQGHEIDPHAHESHVAYHEVRQRIIAAGGSPTPVASGLVESQIDAKMAYFDGRGSEFKILWGVANAGHGSGEVRSGWVWRPSRTDWLEHDPGARYIVIGGGEMGTDVSSVKAAIDGRRSGQLNTYSVFVTPRWFLAARGAPGIPEQWTTDRNSPDYWENRLATWEAFFSGLDSYTAAGTLRYATLTTVADLFEQNEGRVAPDADVQHPRSSGDRAGGPGRSGGGAKGSGGGRGGAKGGRKR